MKTFLKKNGRTLVLIVTVFVGLLLIISATFMLSDYRNELSAKAGSAAKYNIQQTKEVVAEYEEQYCNFAVEVATNTTNCSTRDQIINYFSDLRIVDDNLDNLSRDVERVKDIRFIKDGQVYTFAGNPIGINDSEPGLAYYTADKFNTCFIGTTYSSEFNMLISGFITPVYNCEYADSVVVYYTYDILRNFYDPADNGNSLREFSVIISNSGAIVCGDKKSSIMPEGSTLIGNNLIEEIKKVVIDDATQNQIKKTIKGVGDGYVPLTINLDSYILVVSNDDQVLSGLSIVELYKVSDLAEEAYNFVSAITAIIILFAVITVGVIIYLITHNVRTRKHLLISSYQNELLGCFNRVGFEKEATKLVDINPSSNFSIMSVELKHFKFIQENSSEAVLNESLRVVKYSISKFLQESECFGYNEAGEFLVLAHSKDRGALLDKIKSFNAVLLKNKVGGKDLLLKYGIYEIDTKENLPMTKMIDFAREANNTIMKGDNNNAGIEIHFYDEELRKRRAINEDMELRMESALKNGEFQVFYQPKFNLNLGRQDGAEALVRWYDKTTNVYNRPDLFMTLFESNGFIAKLDRYVFERVCEYIQYSIAHGRTVYPVSVNISRVTAIQPDFVNFYAMIKKRYAISDGLIMIEFTESFAYENYNILFDIVDKLHKAGFKCSIDDFGCGYSSYRILKTLPMDEIKLDKFFMDKGLDEKRDEDIFKSIIKLGKDLHMKVTQEGVETEEGVKLLKKMGCDVIQGFIYAHPMPLSDYIKFVQTSREHDLK